MNLANGSSSLGRKINTLQSKQSTTLLSKLPTLEDVVDEAK